MTASAEEFEELVRLASTGDQRARDRVIAVIYPKVLRYTRARIAEGRALTAEDVAQEACLAIAQSLPRYADQGKPFIAFAYGVTAHKVQDAYRVFGRDRSNPTDDLPDQASRDGLPEEQALARDEGNRVRRILDSLSEKPRDILILRIFVGLTAEETADIVGSTPGAVRVAQHRALNSLRQALQQGK